MLSPLARAVKFIFSTESDELENDFITNIILGGGILVLMTWLWGSMALPIAARQDKKLN